MSTINNEPTTANAHSTAISAYETLEFKPVVTASYSESQAVTGLIKSVNLATEVVSLFSTMAGKEGKNIQALADFWTEKDQQIARSQVNQ